MFFWTLLYKAWNISLPVRKGQSFTVTGSPIFHNDICRLCYQAAFCFGYWLMSGWSQQLCISKFTFACICLSFCSLSMMTLCSNFACSSLYFYLSHLYSYCRSFMHIVHILYILPCHFLQTKLNLQYLCSWGFLDHTHIRVCYIRSWHKCSMHLGKEAYSYLGYPHVFASLTLTVMFPMHADRNIIFLYLNYL